MLYANLFYPDHHILIHLIEPLVFILKMKNLFIQLLITVYPILFMCQLSHYMLTHKQLCQRVYCR